MNETKRRGLKYSPGEGTAEVLEGGVGHGVVVGPSRGRRKQKRRGDGDGGGGIWPASASEN